MITLGNQSIMLDTPVRMSIHENSSRILQRDYLNAIMQVRVEKEVRTALNQVDVREGEAHLDTWVVTGKGTYVGSWSKRLAKYMYKEHNVKLDPAVISVITERVSKTMAGIQDELVFEFSKEPWEAGEFGEKADSCWFGGRSYSHCQRGLLENPNGGAIKFYAPPMAGSGRMMGGKRARCWYYNIEGSLLIFNAYDRLGKMDILSMARIISMQYGMDYMKHFEVNVDTAYVNGRSIYAIGNPPISRPITLDFALRAKKKLPEWMDDEPAFEIKNNLTCPSCGGHGNRELSTSGIVICSECRMRCPECSQRYGYMEMKDNYKHDRICPHCLSESYVTCPSCDYIIPANRANNCPMCRTIHSDDDDGEEFYCVSCEEIRTGDRYTTHDGDTICEECRNDNYTYCDHCEEIYPNEETYYLDSYDRYVCDSCRDNHYYSCVSCEHDVHEDDIVTVRDSVYCSSCADEISFNCARCGGTEHQDYAQLVRTSEDENEDPEDWCEDCAHDYADYCANCGEIYALSVDHDQSHGEEEDDED